MNLSVVATKFVDIDDSTVSMRSFLSRKPATTTAAARPAGGRASPVSQTTVWTGAGTQSKRKSQTGSISSFFRSSTVTNTQRWNQGDDPGSCADSSHPTNYPSLTQSQALFSQLGAGESVQSLNTWETPSLGQTQPQSQLLFSQSQVKRTSPGLQESRTGNGNVELSCADESFPVDRRHVSRLMEKESCALSDITDSRNNSVDEVSFADRGNRLTVSDGGESGEGAGREGSLSPVIPVMRRTPSPSHTGVVPESQTPDTPDSPPGEEVGRRQEVSRRAAGRVTPHTADSRSVTPRSDDLMEPEDVFVPCTFNNSEEEEESPKQARDQTETQAPSSDSNQCESGEREEPVLLPRMGFFARRMLELTDGRKREAERLKQIEALRMFPPPEGVSVAETIETLNRLKQFTTVTGSTVTRLADSPRTVGHLASVTGSTITHPTDSPRTTPGHLVPDPVVKPTVNNTHRVSDETPSTSRLVGNPRTNTAPLVENSDYSRCEECGDVISAWDLPEHLDFHFAQKLQREQREQQRLEQQQQRQATTATARTPGNHVAAGGGIKRKAESAKSKLAAERKRSRGSQGNTGQKTLDGFFRRS